MMGFMERELFLYYTLTGPRTENVWTRQHFFSLVTFPRSHDLWLVSTYYANAAS